MHSFPTTSFRKLKLFGFSRYKKTLICFSLFTINIISSGVCWMLLSVKNVSAKYFNSNRTKLSFQNYLLFRDKKKKLSRNAKLIKTFITSFMIIKFKVYYILYPRLKEMFLTFFFFAVNILCSYLNSPLFILRRKRKLLNMWD